MADGVTINQGTNTIVASDDVSGTQYQVIKLDMGGDGVSNPFTGTISAVTNLAGGTITSLQGGTVSSNILSGSITVTASTITVLPNIPGGTIGVVSSVAEVANLAKGTITRLEGGTVSSNILSGSIAVIAGTVASVGTIPGIGVVSNLTSGSVTMTVGTLTVMPNIPGGTLGLITTVTNLSNGTIQSSGTTTGVGVVTSVTNLVSGTLLSSGTTTGVGVVSNLTNGSIRVTLGTIVGAASDGAAVSGNPLLMAGADGGGTVQTLLTDTAGVLQINGTVSTGGAGTQAVRLIDGTLTTLQALPDLPGGTVDLISSVASLTTGTIGLVTTVTNLSNGTIQNSGTTTGVGVVSLLSAGTITKLEQGSINVTAGTTRLDARPVTPIQTYGTIFAGTAGEYATLVAAPGASTAIYITSLKAMNNGVGTLDIMVGWGTALNGTSVIDRGSYALQSGISRQFTPAMSGNITNTSLVVYVGAAGTVAANISYWIQ